jgi:hypothetical protein
MGMRCAAEYTAHCRHASPGYTLCLNELAEVSRHGPLVVGHENAAIARGTGKDFGVIESSQPCRRGGPEVDGGSAPHYGRQNDLVQIGVGLIANRHSARERSLLGGWLT